MNITDEMVKAFADSYDKDCCNDSSADFCCTRSALARVAPLIAAQARARVARYIDRAVSGKRETAAMGLLADTIVADAWAEAAGWLRDDSIWNAPVTACIACPDREDSYDINVVCLLWTQVVDTWAATTPSGPSGA